MPLSTNWTYRSVGSREKKQLSLALSGSFGILAAVLVGMGGGRFGNTEGAEDSQSGSGSKTERDKGSVCRLEGKTGAGGDILLENAESSSKVTHCLFRFVAVEGCD